MNGVLKKELAEKNARIVQLEDQNAQLTLAADEDSIDNIAKLTVERDNYRQ